MNYTQEYMKVFGITRSLLRDEIENDIKFIKECMSVKHELSLHYLKHIADDVTAYNELVTINFFYKCKDFLPE